MDEQEKQAVLSTWAEFVKRGLIRTWPQEQAEVAYRAFCAGWQGGQVTSDGAGRISADLIEEIRKLCTEKGWRTEQSGSREGHEFAAYVALAHSVLSEALEAYRDKLWSETHPQDGKPVGVGPELADTLIRILDMADIWGVDINYELDRVLAYGWKRPYRAWREAAVSPAAKLYPWQPDWVVSPGEMLQEWMNERNLSPETLAVGCNAPRATSVAYIQAVLDRVPMSELTASIIAEATQTTSRLWLALEHNYRAGLARGLKEF
jgi:plasmid maintenance system antidote protein VapI